jgi:hypothetical protein
MKTSYVTICAAAQSAEHRILAVGGKSAEQHAVNRERRHREEEQQPDVEIDDEEARAERDDRSPSACPRLPRWVRA